MGKFDPLETHLRQAGGAAIMMSLDDIQNLVSLPKSAREYDAWWSNEDVRTTTHVQCKAWQNAGYEAEPNFRAGTVTFRRKRGRS
jgi:hypothetical protein